jgi:membrane protein YdbS with pleckstrin-like domain
MPEPVSDDVARNRFIIINLVRLSGVVMVLASMLILANAIEGSYAFGYVLLAAGLVDIFVVPQLLARKWRTPPE